MTVEGPEILYQDSHLLVVFKPNNMLVHQSNYARNLNHKQSLVEWIYELTQSLVYPIHRLDHKTSGLILFSKERENAAVFQKLFENNLIEKKYLALLRGHTEENLSINSPVKNEKGNYKEAETQLKLIEHFTLNIPVEPYATSRYSFVELIPKTGRINQLRLHANKISHPIIGDTRYGNRQHNRMFDEKLGIPFMFLHAESLRFPHPFRPEYIEVKANLPKFWELFQTEIVGEYRQP